MIFFFSSRRRHTRCLSDWSSDVCSSDLKQEMVKKGIAQQLRVAQGKIEGPQEDGQTSVFYYNGNEYTVPTDKWADAFQRYKKQTDVEHEEVIAVGGLHILGTERHESRRIDNQLRGR